MIVAPIQENRGFTLIELVVVILILGILAGIATPKLLKISANATDNGLRQTLSIIRDAIALYSADAGGSLPGADESQVTFRNDLDPYLRGGFPLAPVGPKKGTNSVVVDDAGGPLEGEDEPDMAWAYDFISGLFILNYNGLSQDGVTKYDEF